MISARSDDTVQTVEGQKAGRFHGRDSGQIPDSDELVLEKPLQNRVSPCDIIPGRCPVPKFLLSHRYIPEICGGGGGYDRIPRGKFQDFSLNPRSVATYKISFAKFGWFLIGFDEYYMRSKVIMQL